MLDKIEIKGAKVHNLKNISLTIPRDKLIVLTGLSGSGKSSLAFDTIYAEGQRRYIESLSSYARQFLGQMDKPDVDYIEGLSPAISIAQKTTSHNPRSTVGTVTEIYDYLRLLFARIGQPCCPKCGKPIQKQTVQQMVDKIYSLGEGTRLQILAPVVRGKKGEFVKLLEKIRRSGFSRVRVDGQVWDLSEDIKLEKNKKHNLELVVDRIIVRDSNQSRLAGSLETALQYGEGLVIALLGDSKENSEEEIIFSENFACVDCGISIPEIEPRLFSFNNPLGACSSCTGLGFRQEIDPKLVISNKNISILDGAIKGFQKSNNSFAFLEALALKYNFSLDCPIEKLSDKAMRVILYGTEGEKLEVKFKEHYGNNAIYNIAFEGVIPNLIRRYKKTQSEYIRRAIEGYMSTKPCPDCKGKRLKKEVLSVLIGGISIAEMTSKSVVEILSFLENLKISARQEIIASRILKEIRERLGFLINVGLDYLTLDRMAGTLSGGEAQRIRLATQIGSGLMGVLYILDEPSIGLHQRDNQRLLNALLKLKNLGNTLIVVEHDEETIRMADYIVDIGPGAGEHGGEVVAAGTFKEVMQVKNSLTAQYLSGKKFIPVPENRRKIGDKCIQVVKATENNLKEISVDFPLNMFICVTGVSGSGKSTLVNEVLCKELLAKLNRANVVSGACKEIKGFEYLDKVIEVDQSPIGRTPRSNPATYTGLFNDIRELFSNLPEAKLRGYKPGRFSFNVKGGRCEACQGDGIVKIEMHFLPDVYVPCEVCQGKRYNRETLEVFYKEKNIADILQMTVEQALEFFEHIPKIKHKLQTLCDVGLGYIRLGQPAPELSGGEAQRVKLATELSRRSKGKTMYILDEPTTGLHIADVDRLLRILHRLVEAGDTVLVIEHNLEVIKTADYLIDLGPEGGNKGGQIVAMGSPEEVALLKESYTGLFLKEILEKDKLRKEHEEVILKTNFSDGEAN